MTYHGTKIKSKAGSPRVIISPNFSFDNPVNVTFFARPLLTPIARKLFRYEHGVNEYYSSWYISVTTVL